MLPDISRCVFVAIPLRTISGLTSSVGAGEVVSW